MLKWEKTIKNPGDFSTQLKVVSSQFSNTGFRPPASCFRLPTPDIRLLTSDLWLSASDLRHPTSDFQLPTSNFRPPTSGFLLPISDIRLPTSDLWLPTSCFRTRLQYLSGKHYHKEFSVPGDNSIILLIFKFGFGPFFNYLCPLEF